MYKILLFGSSGMLGSYVNFFFSKNSLYEVHCIDRKQLQIDTAINIQKISSVVKRYNGDSDTYILNCIGLIPQRNPTDIKDYYIINTIFPMLLSNVAETYKCKFIHFTTDCIYDGKNGNYDELSEYSANSDYGISKLMGDNNVNYGEIIRTSIIGLENANKKSFLEWVLSSNGKKVQGYTNHIWNGITCLEYCKFINYLIVNNYISTERKVRHIFSPYKVSKYELVNIIKDVFNLDIEVEKVESNPCDRSLSSISPIDYKFKHIKEQIVDLLTFDMF